MRFLLCSARVRTIGVPHHHDCPPEEFKLICTIIKHNGDSTFLPSLRTLFWALRNGNDLLPPLFAPQSLHSLHLTPSYVDPAAIIGKSIRQFTPSIRSLSINIFHHLKLVDPKLQESVVDIALSLKNLESFMIRQSDSRDPSLVFTPFDIQRLGKSPTLTYIAVDIAPFQGAPALIELPRIRGLECTGRITDILTLLKKVKAPLLDLLDLPEVNVYAAAHLEGFMRDLSNMSLARTLQSLYLSIFQHWDGRLSVNLSTFLKPCISMSKLEKLYLHNSMWRNVLSNDEDIREIAQYLPDSLRYLSLPDFHYSPWPSFTLLRHFARHCPNLVELELRALCLDSRMWQLHYSEEINEDSRPHLGFLSWKGDHPLQILRTGDMLWGSLPDGMEQEDVEKTGAYLNALFPNLDLSRMREILGKGLPPECRSSGAGYYSVLNAVEAAREEQGRRAIG